MRYIVDHDLHIHSNLSTCSRCPEQTPERIAQYAVDTGLKTICMTDHFWDEKVPGASPWYQPQDFPHISRCKPLPQPQGVRFLFGCETELDKNLTLGISPERMQEMDFIIIPTTHFHFEANLTDAERASVAGRVSAWIRRLGGVLDMALPFHKVGLAHLTCKLINRDREEFLQILAALPEDEMTELFQKAAQCGVGIELNAADICNLGDDADIILRPYRIAKACGCKFYLGSDSHNPNQFGEHRETFEKAVTLLSLTEDDKFILR
ncbi:MAG: PHP domain-containing protein [Oscillospiraceae bacterium]|nr:PHP domain-containing protein [Oscillospiraceae bacterium]